MNRPASTDVRLPQGPHPTMAHMDRRGELWPEADRAVAHVAERSVGDPVEPTLRVTLNFHPDRLAANGDPVIEAMARNRGPPVSVRDRNQQRGADRPPRR